VTQSFTFGAKAPDRKAVVSSITEVAIYARALDAARIAAHHTLGTTT